MKILAAGCSFTSGAELPDTVNSMYAISQYAYPAILGKYLNAEVNNISLSGGSNGRIFRKVVDERSKNNYDIVICGWTTTERLDLQYENKDIPGASGSEWLVKTFPWTKIYYTEHFSFYHSSQTWYAQLLTLQSYFKSINQKYVFLSLFPPVEELHKEWFPHLIDQIDPTYFVGWENNLGMVDFMGDCPKGPGGHPLELGQKRIADTINEHIRNLGWVS